MWSVKSRRASNVLSDELSRRQTLKNSLNGCQSLNQLIIGRYKAFRPANHGRKEDSHIFPWNSTRLIQAMQSLIFEGYVVYREVLPQPHNQFAAIVLAANAPAHPQYLLDEHVGDDYNRTALSPIEETKPFQNRCFRRIRHDGPDNKHICIEE